MRRFKRHLRTRHRSESAVVALIFFLVGVGCAAGWAAYRQILEGR